MRSVRLTLLLLFSAAFSVFSTAPPSSCSSENSPSNGQASALLQMEKLKLVAASPARPSEEDSHGPRAALASNSWLKLGQLSASDTMKPPAAPLAVQPGQARAILTPSLFEFGVGILGSEATLDTVVANTAFQNVTYSGEQLYMRMVNGDCFPDERGCLFNFGTKESDVYGLTTLNTLPVDQHGMITLLDVGGNCGVVPVAAFKKEPTRLRIVTVEPVPSTYFLLVWNLHLNGATPLSQPDFLANPKLPGILALNKGVAAADGEKLDLCYTPPFTMNARICNCATQPGPVSHQPLVPQCASVQSQSFGSLLGLFQNPTHLSFLKVDCEGCEMSLLPALDAVAANPSWKLGRLAGELHGMGNALEDVACKFEGGKWVEHICNLGPPGVDNIWGDANLTDRCPLGATRKPCWHADGTEGIR